MRVLVVAFLVLLATVACDITDTGTVPTPGPTTDVPATVAAELESAEAAGQSSGTATTLWLATATPSQITAEEPNTKTRSEANAYQSQASYIRTDTIPEGESAQPDQWYYSEETTENQYVELVEMFISDSDIYTAYVCSTPGEQTIPWIRVGYPQPLRAELITRVNALPIETTVNGKILDVEWVIAATRDTDIKLRGADAQRLVQTLIEQKAGGYHLAITGVSETSHFVNTEGLGDVLVDAGVNCLLSEVKGLDPQVFNPPTVLQEPRNGLYTYTSPDGRFTFQYPDDCGQLWESTKGPLTEVDNAMNCPGSLGEMSVYAHTNKMDEVIVSRLYGSPEQIPGRIADNLAERLDNSERYSIESDTGLNIEVVESPATRHVGTEVLVTGIHARSDGSYVYLLLGYWEGEDAGNHKRALTTLRTIDSRPP